MKTDITDYSDDELSSLVFNDEGLYLQRNKRGFFEILDEIFIYTDEQLDVLKQDLSDEREENEK